MNKTSKQKCCDQKTGAQDKSQDIKKLANKTEVMRKENNKMVQRYKNSKKHMGGNTGINTHQKQVWQRVD